AEGATANYYLTGGANIFGTRYQVSSDGLPLGLINLCATGVIDFGFEVEGPGTSKPATPARSAYLVGAGSLQVNWPLFFDAGVTPCRSRTQTNLYQGLGDAPAELSALTASNTIVRMRDGDVQCAGANLLEFYDTPPAEINLSGLNALNSEASLGVWFDSSITLD